MLKDKCADAKGRINGFGFSCKEKFNKCLRQIALLSLMIFSTISGFIIFLVCGCMFLFTSLVVGLKYRKELQNVYDSARYSHASV